MKLTIFLSSLFIIVLSVFLTYHFSRYKDPTPKLDWREYVDEYGLHCSHKRLLNLNNPKYIRIDPNKIFPVDISLQNEARNRLNGKTFAKLFSTEIDRFSIVKEQEGYSAYLVQACFYQGKEWTGNHEEFLEILSYKNFTAVYDQEKKGVGTGSLSPAVKGDIPRPYVYVLWHDQPIEWVNPGAAWWR